MRESFKIQYGTTQAYKRYKEKILPNKAKEFDVSASTHAKIIEMYHSLVRDKMIYKNFIYRIPVLGMKIRIKKYKQKLKYDEQGNIIKSELPVNWKATNELWKSSEEHRLKKTLIFHLNDHTDGYRYRVSKMPIGVNKLVSKYSFVSCRKFDRDLSSFLQDPFRTIDYYE